MKIDGNIPNSNLEPLAPAQTDATRLQPGAQGTQTGAAASADTVELSADAQLADRLRQAVAATPDIRQDKVDEARRKLEAGQIGQDPMALASRLIDQMQED